MLFAWPFLPRLARAEGRDPRLLTIVLRGALDGLALVGLAGVAVVARALVAAPKGSRPPLLLPSRSLLGQPVLAKSRQMA